MNFKLSSAVSWYKYAIIKYNVLLWVLYHSEGRVLWTYCARITRKIFSVQGLLFTCSLSLCSLCACWLCPRMADLLANLTCSTERSCIASLLGIVHILLGRLSWLFLALLHPMWIGRFVDACWASGVFLFFLIRNILWCRKNALVVGLNDAVILALCVMPYFCLHFLFVLLYMWKSTAWCTT